MEITAEKYQLDPDFIYALMREESLFNPIVHSSAGAIGLMQLMYRTARGVTGAVGLKNFRKGDLHDPSINILLGSWFISHQLKRLDENPILAIAAYNGGPTNVRRWLRRSPESDIDLFLEKIPYPETRSHVRKVFRTYQQYKNLWRS